MPLSNLQLLVLSKSENILGKDRCTEIRNAVEAGNHSVDFYVHVHGSVAVGKDGDSKIPTDHHEWPLLLRLLGDKSAAEREEIIRSVLAAPAPTKAAVEVLKEEIAALVVAVKGEQRRPARGAVKAIVFFDALDTQSSPAAGASPFGG